MGPWAQEGPHISFIRAIHQEYRSHKQTTQLFVWLCGNFVSLFSHFACLCCSFISLCGQFTSLCTYFMALCGCFFFLFFGLFVFLWSLCTSSWLLYCFCACFILQSFCISFLFCLFEVIFFLSQEKITVASNRGSGPPWALWPLGPLVLCLLGPFNHVLSSGNLPRNVIFTYIWRPLETQWHRF